MSDSRTTQLLAQLRAALGQGKRAAVNQLIAELLHREAPIGRSWRSLAEVLVSNGELSLALRAGKLYVRAADNEAAAQFFYASLMARCGDVSGALVALSAVPHDVPSIVENSYTRGTIALNLGAFDDARADLQRAVAADPQSGQSWLALAMTGKAGGSSDIARQILGAKRPMRQAPARERAQHLYACGKVLDDLGDDHEAFEAFAEGAVIIHENIKPNREQDARSAEAAIAGYDRRSITAFNAQITIPTDRPIIVTGSPRSGTTLVEQILASHSDVAGGEELGRSMMLASEIGGVGAGDLSRWISAGGKADYLADTYLHFLHERFGAVGRAVDKTPDASRYLGLLASILPDAKIVWLQRDPLDRAWSCFRTFFLRGAAWSYSQLDIAAHFKLEDALLAHWGDCLGGRLLVLDYEALVRQPEQEIRRLLEFCSLTEEPQVFRPEQAKRAVTTASVAQVRSPINANAIGSAARYRKHLRPFTDAYF